jgi:hypothetical protein
VSGLFDFSVPAWMERAACKNKREDYADKGGDPQEVTELFFPATKQPKSYAERLCGGCPVRTECLEWALQTDSRFGVFGGITETARVKLHRRYNKNLRDQETA